MNKRGKTWTLRGSVKWPAVLVAAFALILGLALPANAVKARGPVPHVKARTVTSVAPSLKGPGFTVITPDVKARAVAPNVTPGVKARTAVGVSPATSSPSGTFCLYGTVSGDFVQDPSDGLYGYSLWMCKEHLNHDGRNPLVAIVNIAFGFQHYSGGWKDSAWETDGNACVGYRLGNTWTNQYCALHWHLTVPLIYWTPLQSQRSYVNQPNGYYCGVNSYAAPHQNLWQYSVAAAG